mmetsp:Transcript_14794/g.38200  ORF Transcript_14794/g.38200 Transcript_14794/m.38200 type:complete len:280 (-) Transcript_14794:12-851(-)
MALLMDHCDDCGALKLNCQCDWGWQATSGGRDIRSSAIDLRRDAERPHPQSRDRDNADWMPPPSDQTRRTHSSRTNHALPPQDALAMAHGDRAMAFGAMVGAVRASMVPPGGVRPGVLPRDRCAHGEGYSFGAVIGDLRARNSSLEEECEYNADTAQAIANSLKDVPPQQESLWERYAKGITSEQDLRRLFQRRQSTPASTDPKLEIETATKVQNDQMLQRFESARLTPLYRDGFDDFLFHGSSQLSIANIIAQGLSTSRDAAHGRMLGVGIYGAPDPR